jgi:glycosyltransferase involved in cell wall biosynthesis
MNVLIVYPKIYVYGGAELVIVKLCNYLSDRGIKNTLLTTFIVPEVKRDLKETNIIVKKGSKDTMNILQHTFFLWRKVRDYLDDFDLINVHNYPAEMTAFLSSKPVVWMCNEPQLNLSMESATSLKRKFLLSGLMHFEKFLVKRYIDAVIVADEFNAERFKRIYGITPYIVNYGVDYDFFSHEDAKKIKHKMDLDNKFVILQVGMLQPFKNQLASLKTVKEVKNKISNLVLILVGYWIEGYKLKLEKYIKQNSLEDVVVFTGHIDREDLRDLYYACDVLIHPIKSQGGWLSPFEALCARKPIVVSPEMTASNIIMREKIGVVTNSFAKVVMEIYKDPDKYHEMATRGGEWVRKNLSWDNFCEKTLDLFYRAINDSLR